MPKLTDTQAAVAPAPGHYEIPDMSDRGEKVRVSYSELSTFRDCPLKWQLKYYWRLQRPDRILRLDRGTAWHKMLEANYAAIQNGFNRAETRARVLLALNDYNLEIGGMEDGEFETLNWMYTDYCRIYGSDPEYTTVQVEEAFEFPMPVEGAPGLVIVGRIDHETINSRGQREVWDHKSASQRDVSKDGFLNEMLLEDQFVLYAAAKREGGTPVERVVYNVARTDRLKRKMTDEERFNRVAIHYPDAAMNDVWADNVQAATALVRMWNDPDAVYSVPNPRQCGWKCDFQKAHLESRFTGKTVVEASIDYGFVFKPRGVSGDAPVELEAEADNAELESW